MAKHPHKLILLQKKTWKCAIQGCTFFVHLGLAHVLIGKTAICWKCNEQFTVDEYSLKNEMPVCLDCRLGIQGKPSLEQINDFIERKLAEGKKSDKEINTLKTRGVIPEVQVDDISDEIEVIEPNEPESE